MNSTNLVRLMPHQNPQPLVHLRRQPQRPFLRVLRGGQRQFTVTYTHGEKINYMLISIHFIAVACCAPCAVGSMMHSSSQDHEGKAPKTCQAKKAQGSVAAAFSVKPFQQSSCKSRFLRPIVPAPPLVPFSSLWKPSSTSRYPFHIAKHFRSTRKTTYTKNVDKDGSTGWERQTREQHNNRDDETSTREI